MLVRVLSKIKLKIQEIRNLVQYINQNVFQKLIQKRLNPFLLKINWEKYRAQYLYSFGVILFTLLSLKYKNLFGGAISLLLVLWGYDRFLKKV